MTKILIFLILILAAGPLFAADAEIPHPHQGILNPYEPVALEITLDEKQLERLAKGKLVQMTIMKEETGGTGIGVIDIAAPPEIVWSRINGFEHYVEWVGPVKFCEVYHQAGDTTNSHVVVSGFLYKYEYFLTNVFWSEQSMLIWTLDYSRESDFDDCVGVWYVEPHPQKAGWSRAWFANDLILNSPLPGFLKKIINKKGIKNAISWVKKQSETVVDEG